MQMTPKASWLHRFFITMIVRFAPHPTHYAACATSASTMRHVSFASNNVQTERKNTDSAAHFLHEVRTKDVEAHPLRRLSYKQYNATLRIRLSSEAKLLAKSLRRHSTRRCAVLMNVFLRAWRRLGRAQELVGIVGGMLAVLTALVAGFHAGYTLHLTHTHEVVTSCRPVANDYALMPLDLS